LRCGNDAAAAERQIASDRTPNCVSECRFGDPFQERRDVGRATQMIAPLTSAAASLLMLTVIVAPTADNPDCRNATKQYDDAVAKLKTALHEYENCVDNSRGRNDCAAEIKAVDDAHDDFEEAVADFGDACPK